jgi:hypothetical protein
MVKPILEATHRVLACPMRAVKTVADLNIPVSAYESIAKEPVVFGDDNTFVPATVKGVPIPSFAASVASFKEAWKLLKACFSIRRMSNNSYGWDVKECIRFLLRTPAFARHIADPSCLEIIVRGDGFPVGGKHAIFLVVTLGNFGVLGKSIGFNMPINLAEVDEGNREEVRAALQDNLAACGELARDGHWEVSPGKVVQVRVEYGGDEAWLRMMLGVLSSKESLACLKCFWLRGTTYDPAARVERVLSLMQDFAATGSIDQSARPLIMNARIFQIHHCAMHAIIPFGKDLLNLCFHHLQQLGRSETTALANAWLKKNRISYVNIAYPETNLLVLSLLFCCMLIAFSFLLLFLERSLLMASGTSRPLTHGS